MSFWSSKYVAGSGAGEVVDSLMEKLSERPNRP